MAEYEVYVDTDPDPRDLVRQLRVALGWGDVALPYSPKRAWEEAVAEVRRLVEAHVRGSDATKWTGHLTCSSCGESWAVGSHIIGSTAHICPDHSDGGACG